MKFPDRWSSLSLIFLSILLCIESYRLKLGSYYAPGPGFLPFWIGLIIIILSLILFFQSVRMDQEENIENILMERNWKNILLLIASLFIYTLILEKLGFVISTFVFIAFILRLVETKRWPVVVNVAVAAALGTYLIFEVWLQTQLPRGVLG